ncbi:MAG: DNA polymerase III [Candidatus Omnitrophica bacterium CG11_big_fil_rev_8_21_14_0_20_42_13]|uniref:DNA polymerase beta n=1 Tax=Candidatus Ghiorseimicrobium undicola TaxID=1974746 RepID=A0A2H0LWN3_9BACT|nr:MAG: DNA polymerase III [Candidatus Omnitrophica bacterium CG11_big_fil_rev_8_21_14_0_20_42_13]
MLNKKVADIFRNIAHILEIKGDNPFKIRAYLKAADSLENVTEDLEDVEREGRLAQIEGIGKDLAAKISEFIGFDRIKYYDELKKEVPGGLLDLLSIPGVGPKTAKLLYDKLKIADINTLEKYAREGKLRNLEGLKEKTEENILRGIELVKKGRERMDLGTAFITADKFISLLQDKPYVKKISFAGSLRRMKDTVRDIDILISSAHPEKVIDDFTRVEEVKSILNKGDTKSAVLTGDGVQVDLRVVPDNSFGAALLYFSGSKAHNIKLRQLAQKKGLKINEYGVFRARSVEDRAKAIAGKTENEIYKLLGMPFIEPELREDNGELEAALKNKLPVLINSDDIKGDLHMHSLYSDGHYSIKDMANAALKKGYDYVALTDHSIALKVANGLDLAALKRKRLEIEKLNKGLKIRILFGTEVELDNDGNTDYSDKVLSEFDIVVGAIHSGFRQPKEKITKRLIKACRNRHIDIIAHPTGRLWGVRDAYEVDFGAFFKAAADTGTFLEINSFPTRLDLNDVNARHAKESGVKIAISTDSHHIAQLDFIRFGVAVARRAWMTKHDVANTLSLKELMRVKKK